MAIIDIKLKTYEQLQFEIMTLITDKYLLQTRINKAIEYIESKIQHRSYKVNDIIRKYDYLEMFDETIVELLDILKGEKNE